MSTSALVFLALAALCVFWAVGAHNRLVRLSHAVVAAYAPVDAYLRARQLMLHRWLEGVAASGLGRAERTDIAQALQAVQNALEEASRRSLGPAELTRLSQAEQALDEALAGLWSGAADPQGATRSALRGLIQPLFEANEQIALTAVPYLAALLAYNQAVTEFPAVLVARLSRLRALPEFSVREPAAYRWAAAEAQPEQTRRET